MSDLPIAIFDSGVGGLSVMHSIINHLPSENIIYCGDIARIPYGIKSVALIRQFTRETIIFLLTKQIKALVIACNTIAAVAADIVTDLANNIPVINILESGVYAAAYSKCINIGIIATQVTVDSKIFQQKIHLINSHITTYSIPCSLLVSMIEEGFAHHVATELIATHYLASISHKIDCLLLGCTHYPFIIKILQRIIGNHIPIINPADVASEQLYHLLSANNMLNQHRCIGDYIFYVTDVSSRFRAIAQTFLAKDNINIQVINLSDIHCHV